MEKIQVLNLQLCRKINSITSILKKFFLPFRNTSFKENLKEKSNSLEMQCILLPKVCIDCSSFSAVGTCTFNWTMVDILQNKAESLDWPAPAFKCGQQKNVEIHNGNYSPWYMKIIWKLQYEFAHARINRFTL